MALLSTYSDDNKNVLTENKPIVLKTLVWLNGYGRAWNVETIERQSYEYIGMTKAAADTCAADMVEQWTIDMTDSFVDEAGTIQTETAERLVADIAVVLQGGLMYKVTVDVNKVSNAVSALTVPE
jgi:hypothetical protein